MKLQLKVNVNAWKINHEDLNEFLNSNKIIELIIDGLQQEIMLHDYFYEKLRYLKIFDDHKFIDLKKFTSL